MNQSLHEIPADLTEGTVYAVKVGYSNILHPDASDIDGVKLFAYKGGVELPARLDSITPNPAFIPVGTDTTFTAQGSGLAGVAWTATGSPTPATGTGSTFTTKWTTPGNYVVTATLGSQTKTSNVTVLAIDKIVVAGTPDTGPRTVPKNSPLQLQAIPLPTGALFPNSLPQWNVTSGATIDPNMGALTTFQSSAAGSFTVTATCGTSVKTFTVNVADVSLYAADDTYYLNGESLNDTLTDPSTITKTGKNDLPANAAVSGVWFNDGEQPIPDTVTFELVSGPLYDDGSFSFNTSTGAFTYKPKDEPGARWMTKTFEWDSTQTDDDDWITGLDGRDREHKNHADYFVYRLTTTVGGQQVSTADAIAWIYPPRRNRTGNGNDSTATPLGGLALVGGAEDGFTALFQWVATRANGGDVVILQASGDSAYYNDQISSQTPAPNSVTTLVLNTAGDANNAAWATLLQNAEAIYIGGGDQGQYISQWRGTAVGDALVAKAGTCRNADGCAMIGTSAGMHVLGEVDYTAIRTSAFSSVVLPNPRHKTISEVADTPLEMGETLAWPGIQMFDGSFLNVQTGIMDTHFEARDRMGRWLIMMAKTGKSGVAVGERTAYVQEPGVAARVLEQSQNGVFLSGGMQNASWAIGAFQGMTTLTKLQIRFPTTQTYGIESVNGTLQSQAAASLIYGVE